jgi:hypothetical protein
MLQTKQIVKGFSKYKDEENNLYMWFSIPFSSFGHLL